MDYKKSLEKIEKALSDLREENKNTPIVVEGEKDIAALRKLDVKGTIISLNVGLSITSFADYIADIYDKIIVLTDWDRRGGFLCRRIMKNLRGRVVCDTYYREVLGKNSITKTVEGLPSWIDSISNRVNSNLN